MLTTEQEDFLKTHPVGSPAEITMESPTVPGAVATVELTGGTYWQALEVLAWVASRDAAKVVAQNPSAEDVSEGLVNEWELANPVEDFQAILRLRLSSPSDFEAAARSIADEEAMIAVARKIYRDHSRS